ncbi:MAG: AraC family transcriptional regulator, partial [Planctomycetota bacterium]
KLQIRQTDVEITRRTPDRMKSLTHRPLEENLPPWGVLVLESHHSDDFSMDYREHPFYKFIYVLRGRGVVEIGRRVVHFEEGGIVSVPPRQRNRITDAPDAASSLYVCCIATQVFAFDPSLEKRLPLGALNPSAYLSTRIASSLRRMRYQQGSRYPVRSLSMVSSAMRILEWMIQFKASQTKRSEEALKNPFDEQQLMQDYVARLSTEFFEATTIDDAASSIGLSRRSFTHLFQKTTGSTWLSYVRGLAIQHAKHQLAQTDMSIASVAFESGFNDLSTFYRQFKSQVGMSPRKYRLSIG